MCNPLIVPVSEKVPSVTVTSLRGRFRAGARKVPIFPGLVFLDYKREDDAPVAGIDYCHKESVNVQAECSAQSAAKPDPVHAGYWYYLCPVPTSELSRVHVPLSGKILTYTCFFPCAPICSSSKH